MSSVHLTPQHLEAGRKGEVESDVHERRGAHVTQRSRPEDERQELLRPDVVRLVLHFVDQPHQQEHHETHGLSEKHATCLKTTHKESSIHL